MSVATLHPPQSRRSVSYFLSCTSNTRPPRDSPHPSRKKLPPSIGTSNRTRSIAIMHPLPTSKRNTLPAIAPDRKRCGRMQLLQAKFPRKWIIEILSPKHEHDLYSVLTTRQDKATRYSPKCSQSPENLCSNTKQTHRQYLRAKVMAAPSLNCCCSTAMDAVIYCQLTFEYRCSPEECRESQI
jgi:hypothetical protein